MSEWNSVYCFWIMIILINSFFVINSFWFDLLTVTKIHNMTTLSPLPFGYRRLHIFIHLLLFLKTFFLRCSDGGRALPVGVSGAWYTVCILLMHEAGRPLIFPSPVPAASQPPCVVCASGSEKKKQKHAFLKVHSPGNEWKKCSSYQSCLGSTINTVNGRISYSTGIKTSPVCTQDTLELLILGGLSW